MDTVWVGPRLLDGVHVVRRQDLQKWGDHRGLHGRNLVQHVDDPASDHKSDGWRLVERTRWVQHVNHPGWIIPALGTVDMFIECCTRAADDRSKLSNKRNVQMLLGGKGRYANGKPYTKWQLKLLDRQDAEARLRVMVARAEKGIDALAQPAECEVRRRACEPYCDRLRFGCRLCEIARDRA